MIILDEIEILQLKDKITDSICDLLNEKNLCPSNMSCSECMVMVLKTISK